MKGATEKTRLKLDLKFWVSDVTSVIDPNALIKKVSLSIRSSSNQQQGSEFFYSSVELRTENSQLISNPIETFVMLHNYTQLPPDVRIHVDLFTETPSSVGQLCPNESGTASISIRDVKKEIEKFPNKNHFRIPIICYQMRGRDEEMQNTVGYVELEFRDVKALDKVLFRKPLVTDILDENVPMIRKALQSNIDTCVHYIRTLNPIVDELRDIECPTYNNVMQLPGKMFFVDPTIRNDEDEERFFGNLLQISIDRNQKTTEWFNDTIENKFDKGIFDEDVLLACKILGDTTTTLSTTTNYKSDQEYFNGKLVNIENFSITERLIAAAGDEAFKAGVDCEDSGLTNVTTGHRIQTTKFKARALKNLQKLANSYTFFGALSSIQGAQIRDTDGGVAKIFIGSEYDKKIKAGAHIFGLAIPYMKFSEMIKEGPSPNDVRFIKWDKMTENHKKIGKELKTLILEGTGPLNPLGVYPPQCYTKDRKTFESKREEHIERLETMKLIESSLPGIGAGMIQRHSIHEDDEPDLFPVFYRYIKSIITPTFHKTGDIFTFSDGKNSGISIRSLTLSSNVHADLSKEKFYRKPTLQMYPREDPLYTEVFTSMRNQLPIHPRQDVTEQQLQVFGNSITQTGVKRVDSLERLQQELDRITEERKQNIGKNVKTISVVSTYKHDGLFDRVNRDNIVLINQIAQDVKNCPKIIDAKVSMIPITRGIHCVDISFSFLYGGNSNNLNFSADYSRYKSRRHDEFVDISHHRGEFHSIKKMCDQFDNIPQFDARSFPSFGRKGEAESFVRELTALLEEYDKFAQIEDRTIGGFSLFKSIINMKHSIKLIIKFLEMDFRRLVILPRINQPNLNLANFWNQKAKVNDAIHEKLLGNHLLVTLDTNVKEGAVASTMNVSSCERRDVVFYKNEEDTYKVGETTYTGFFYSLVFKAKGTDHSAPIEYQEVEASGFNLSTHSFLAEKFKKLSKKYRVEFYLSDKILYYDPEEYFDINAEAENPEPVTK